MFVVRIGEDRDADKDRDSKGNDGRGVPFLGHPDYFHDPVSRQPLPVTNPPPANRPRASGGLHLHHGGACCATLHFIT